VYVSVLLLFMVTWKIKTEKGGYFKQVGNDFGNSDGL
jgi:hypothetical protein